MNWSLSRRTALTAAGTAALAGDRVVVHPTLPQVPTNNSFTVRVRPAGGTWQTLGVYLVKLALIDPLIGRNTRLRGRSMVKRRVLPSTSGVMP
ncbi:hypothetical protein [Streptomyces sp. 6N223]|uniref:hypothetical protein n=1 Tax=Streptomyces sp. 6N223 TaxID=3457412 RepID=UPI003FCF750B